MSTTVEVDRSSKGAPPTEKPSEAKKSRRLSLRVKITGLFVALFTLVFAVVAFWVVQFSAQTAQDRLASELATTVEGAAETIDAVAFAELVSTVPAVPDSTNDSGLGYPDSPLYGAIAAELYDIFLLADAGTYTWFKDPVDGKLYTAVSSGFLRDPQTGWTYKIPMDTVLGASTYELMSQALTQTTAEPAYTDAYGSWMSAYTPILDADGNSVGAIGQDISLTYVDEVRSNATSQVLPVLLGIYLILVVLVWLVASSIVRPIKRLTGASIRISEGEYDMDVDSLAHSRLRDEISTLAESFGVMASKVAERERSLKVEVKRLKVEIDSAKRAESVSAIVDSDDFAQLAQRAAEMRKRMREE
jgi:HAMP domain-containing protein